jgi:hypothetical protein
VHEVSSDVALAVVDVQLPPSMFTVGLGLLGGLLKNSKHPALSTEHTMAIASDVLVMARALLQ